MIRALLKGIRPPQRPGDRAQITLDVFYGEEGPGDGEDLQMLVDRVLQTQEEERKR